MRNHRRYGSLALAIIVLVPFAAPTAEAGDGVSMHLGSGGFGVSVGFGDWGVYTQSWSDPYWSIDFNATLAGYGQWVWLNGLGRVWQPWVAASWRPYTHGRWVSTGSGLTWVAYEPWGYIPHHYGSWAYASFGWVWVPGHSYSCANVVWVGSGGHVGWYARPPLGWSHAKHGFRHGYRHGFRDGYGNGYNDGWRDARYATYVDWKHFGSDNVSRHAVTHNIASRHRIESRAGAPSRDEIRQRGGAAITKTRLSRRSVRVDGREVIIARPEGVVPSIERNAAESIARSLSERALERRQPLVRSRSASATSSFARPSRTVDVSADARSSQAQRSVRNSSGSPSDRTRISSRSTYVKPSANGTGVSRTNTRVSASRQEGEDSRRIRPRASEASGATEDHRQRHVQPAPRSSRSSSTRQSAQPTRETRGAQKSVSQARRPGAAGQSPEPAGAKASESPRSNSRYERPASRVHRQDTEDESPEKRQRLRRR